jgi:hypothetical protein
MHRPGADERPVHKGVVGDEHRSVRNAFPPTHPRFDTRTVPIRRA